LLQASPIADHSAKAQIIGWRQPISALGEQKRVPNRKKVAKMVGFLFFGGSIAAIGQIQQGRITPTGRIAQKSAEPLRLQRAKTRE
jgi:hypothetical protein